MAPRFEDFPDIVRDARIETTFLDEYTTQHVRYQAGRSARQRRIRKEECWRRSCVLGSGAFGTVYLEQCEEQDGPRTRAVKEVKKYFRIGEEVDYWRELQAIFKFSHPNYAHCFVTADGWYEKDDSIYITMEYLRLGDLQTHLSKPFPELEAKHIARQMVEGLGYMHSNGFVHRDIKPGNIMVVTPGPDWFVKIADFGVSKRRQDGVTTFNTRHQGTSGYAAPEIFGFPQQQNEESYSFAVDMWSFGAVIYKLFTLAVPFPDLGTLFRFAAGDEQFPTDPLLSLGLSWSVCELIGALLSADPKDRPSAASAEQSSWLLFPSMEIEDTPEVWTPSSLPPHSPPYNHHAVYQAPSFESSTDDRTLRNELPRLPVDSRTLLRNASPPSISTHENERVSSPTGNSLQSMNTSRSQDFEEPNDSQHPLNLAFDNDADIEDSLTSSEEEMNGPESDEEQQSEDEVSNGTDVESLTGHGGWRVTCAAGGERSGLETLQSTWIDLLRFNKEEKAVRSLSDHLSTAMPNLEEIFREFRLAVRDKDHESGGRASVIRGRRIRARKNRLELAYEYVYHCWVCWEMLLLIDIPSTSVDCGHKICHNCLYGLFVISLVSAADSTLACCDIEINLESACSELLVDPKLNTIWEKQQRLQKEKHWPCPAGLSHEAHKMETYTETGRISVWWPRMPCDECSLSYCVRCNAVCNGLDCPDFQVLTNLYHELQRSGILCEELLDEFGELLELERSLLTSSDIMDTGWEQSDSSAEAVFGGEDEYPPVRYAKKSRRRRE